MSASSVPLSQALPWSPELAAGRTFLVCDSVETDGRFLLHSLATQVLNHKQKKGARVLWIACGAWTDRLVANALKKMGCEHAASCLRSNTNNTNSNTSLSFDWNDSDADAPSSTANKPLQILSIPVEIATRIEEAAQVDEKEDDNDTDGRVNFDTELFLKELYHRIRSWATATAAAENDSDSLGPTWIVLDDVSALASLLGERLVYFFVLSLRALMNQNANTNETTTNNNNTFGLIMRCANDIDQQDSKLTETNNGVTSVTPADSHLVADWIGAGGQEERLYHQSQSHTPWEHQLVELADGIVDVLPLASGYSREAHGRLVYTARPGGKGWGGGNSSSSDKVAAQHHRAESGGVLPLSSGVINYCLMDNFVMAIRLRGHVS